MCSLLPRYSTYEVCNTSISHLQLLIGVYNHCWRLVSCNDRSVNKLLFLNHAKHSLSVICQVEFGTPLCHLVVESPLSIVDLLHITWSGMLVICVHVTIGLSRMFPAFQLSIKCGINSRLCADTLRLFHAVTMQRWLLWVIPTVLDDGQRFTAAPCHAIKPCYASSVHWISRASAWSRTAWLLALAMTGCRVSASKQPLKRFPKTPLTHCL